ncbi:hypothetical protein Bca4012_052715 [Brassica carinata]
MANPEHEDGICLQESGGCSRSLTLEEARRGLRSDGARRGLRSGGSRWSGGSHSCGGAAERT